jgi:uncharacterized membrane protein YtjA (UPF0391 family)
MLGMALTFLILALIAGVFGFTTIAGASVGIAKILFFIFLVLTVISFAMRALRGQSVV